MWFEMYWFLVKVLVGLGAEGSSWGLVVAMGGLEVGLCFRFLLMVSEVGFVIGRFGRGAVDRPEGCLLRGDSRGGMISFRGERWTTWAKEG